MSTDPQGEASQTGATHAPLTRIHSSMGKGEIIEPLGEETTQCLISP